MSTEFFNDQWRIPSNENQNKVSNYSMAFDAASGNYINAGQSLNIYGSQPRTISCWFNINSFATTSAGDGSNLLGYGAAGSLQAFSIAVSKYQNNPTHRLYLHVWDNNNDISGTTQILENNWYLATVTYDGSILKLYLNGNLEGSSSTSSLNTTTSDFIIGQGILGTWNTLNGKIDQVSVFDYALSQDQVTQLHNPGYAFNFIPNDYIDAGTGLGNSLGTYTGDASVSLWFKADTTESNDGLFSITAFDDVVFGNLRINIYNNELYFVSSGTGNYKTIPFTDTTSWHHLVCIFKSGDITNSKIYLDGIDQTTTDVGTFPSSLSMTGLKTIIGAYHAPANTFDGEMSNVSFFNTGLENSDVQTIYNNGKPLPDMSSFTSLQGWWKLDDSELFNSVSTEWSIENNKYPSTYKSSLNFDGSSSQYINVGNVSDLQGATDFTISSWIKLDSLGRSRIFGAYNPSTSTRIVTFAIDSDNTLISAVSNNGQQVEIRRSTSTIPINTWKHVAITFSSGAVNFYIDGVKETPSATTITQLYNVSTNYFIGALQAADTDFMNGAISNVSIFNTALPATGSNSIATLYNSGRPLADISSFTSLRNWWKLNNTTTGIEDSAGSNDGTNNGATEYAGFVNALAGTSVGMNASNLVASNINGELIANPMATSPKPIAYYQLGDQSVDNGANLLVPNNSLSDYVFDFIPDDYIDLGTRPFLFTQNLTVSFWLKTSQTALNSLIGKDNNNITSGRNWIAFTDSGLVKFWTTSSGSISTISLITSNTSVNDNQWHHIACVNDYVNSTKQIYIDGSLDITNNNGAAISTSSTPVRIGIRDTAPNDFPYDGLMSNVALWDTALNSTQVTTLYNNGAPGDISSLNPTAWYKLDSSEIFNSTSTEWSVDNNAYPSVYKSSLNFNGSSDYIDCGTGSVFNLNQVTISAWINDNQTTNYGTVAGVRKSSDNTVPYLLIKSTAASKIIRFRATQSDGTDVQINSNPIIEANTWYHVVGVADGSNIKMYVNGELQTATNSYDGTLATPDSDFEIGKYPTAPGSVPLYHWYGQISNVAVFNTGLSQSQVTTLYNNGTPEASISHSPFSWWKLDNTTTGIQDSAGSNNGTNNGATKYAGFVNSLGGESSGMDSSNLVVSDLQQTSGYSPYALDFDGIYNKLNLSSIDSTGNKTYSCWIYPTVSGNNGGILTLINSNSDTDFISIALWESEIHALFAVSSTSNNRKNTVKTISANQWYHIAVVKSTGSIDNIYINGANQTLTGSGGWNAASVTSQNQIANAYFGSSFGFAGNISNVATWDVALTSTEITEVYNQGVPSNLNTFSGTAPTAWWQLGSNSSFNSSTWTCLDEIGTNNAVSAGGMTNDDIVDGVGYSASGLGISSIDIKGDAPYSSANGLSENMDVLDRTTDVPS